MRRSLSLAVYLLWARLRGVLKRRNVPEQIKAQASRPPGPLVWMHVADVAESPPIFEVMRHLLADSPAAHCLITTSGKMLPPAIASRLPERVILENLPDESLVESERFLERWQPDLAVWSDFVLRPTLLDRTKRHGVPVILINARLSVTAFRRWRFLRGMVGSLLERFDRVLVQDDASAGYFQALGVPKDRIAVTGALKEGSLPLPHDEAERRALAQALGGRAVWLAAGIYTAEMADILTAFRHARRSFPEVLLVIAPEAPENGRAFTDLCRNDGYKVAQRSTRDTITKRTDIYVADTLGEMGLWYRLSPVAFLGGSLVQQGGHNPFEAAALGSAILHGPHVTDFTGPYRKLTEAGACVEIADGADLAQALKQTLVPERAAEMATAAWIAGSEGAEVTDMVLDVLQSYLSGARS